MDKWQKQKHLLDHKLKEAREGVDKLDEIKRTLKEGERDKDVIALLNSNQKLIKECTGMWSQLKQHMINDEKKRRKKLGDDVIEKRSKLTQNIGKEIVELGNRNRRVRGNDKLEDLEKTTAAAKASTKTQQKKKARREARKNRKKGKDVDDDAEPIEMDEQTQAFIEMKDEAFAEQDQILDEISAGLDELMEIAQDANKELTVQKAMMDSLEKKIDDKNQALLSSNQKLKDMLEETNGLTRWCPMMICIVLLLALVGYIFQMLQ